MKALVCIWIFLFLLSSCKPKIKDLVYKIVGGLKESYENQMLKMNQRDSKIEKMEIYSIDEVHVDDARYRVGLYITTSSESKSPVFTLKTTVRVPSVQYLNDQFQVVE